MTMLSEPQELEWLRETHLKHCKVLPPFCLAVLEGNEDAPDSITLFEEDHVNSITMRLNAWPDGTFRCSSPRY